MNLNAQQLKQLSHDTDALYRGIRDWEDAIFFHTQDIAIGAMPAQTQYYNAVRAFGVTNMDRQNEFIFPTIITEVGVQIFGTVDDIMVVFEHSEVMLEKDQRQYPPMPTASLPGGGGLNVGIADGTAATFHQLGTNGVGNSMRPLRAPIAYVPNQIVRAWLRTDLAVLVAATGVMIMLKGLVARTVV